MQNFLIAFVTGAFGLAAGYFVARFVLGQQIRKSAELTLQHLNDTVAERDALAEQAHRMKHTVQALKADSDEHRSLLKTALDNEKDLSQKARTLVDAVRILRQERETTKTKVNSLQGMLVAVHQRSMALQSEFDKASEFYKEQLTKSFRLRKKLEQEIQDARGQQDEFQKGLDLSVKEHGSAREMIESAQLRLGQISVLERTVNRLEAEKADLATNSKELRKANDSLQRELQEMDELRIHNQQLVMAVEALENSRQEHEDQAEQYRNKAEESEQLSDTLSMKLADLESGFAAMEQEQHQVIRHVRDVAAAARPAANQELSGYAEMTQLVS